MSRGTRRNKNQLLGSPDIRTSSKAYVSQTHETNKIVESKPEKSKKNQKKSKQSNPGGRAEPGACSQKKVKKSQKSRILGGVRSQVRVIFVKSLKRILGGVRMRSVDPRANLGMSH